MHSAWHHTRRCPVAIVTIAVGGTTVQCMHGAPLPPETHAAPPDVQALRIGDASNAATSLVQLRHIPAEHHNATLPALIPLILDDAAGARFAKFRVYSGRRT